MEVAESIKRKIKKVPLISSAAVKLRDNVYKLNAIRKDTQKQFKNPDFRNRAKYTHYRERTRINEHQIVYEAFFGRGMLCNPYAIFLALLEDPRAKNFQHVWVLDDPANHSTLIEEYKNYSNISFVKYNSDEYRKVLCTAKYLVNNTTFPNWFIKKEGQIYINTWHGIPLKTIGYDMPNGRTEVTNTIRNLLQTDYLLSTSPNLTEIYRSAFKLDNVFSGKIVEEGYPRLDILFRFSKNDIFKKLKQYGVEVDPAKKIILYAPTWRGESYGNASNDISSYFFFKEEIERKIDINKYQILIKVHQRIYQLYKEDLVGGFFVPATIDANEILSVTDVLITDFSSIYFDFLATDLPVLFYIPDFDDYLEQRDVYRDLNQLPGPVTGEIAKVAGWINDLENITASCQEVYKREKEWSGAVSDGQISKRIIDGIFFNASNFSTQIVPVEKKKILISLGGGLRMNGISTSLINLLNNFDFDKYDVSLLLAKSPDKDGEKRIDDIPLKVRVLYRNSSWNITRWELVQYQYHLQFGKVDSEFPAYRREFIRICGAAKFDYILDFEGYNRFYSLLTLQDHDAISGIWMHNDMFSEYKVRFPQLSKIFNMYYLFDVLISCSKEIMEVNKEKLSNLYHIEKEKFKYARNTLDASKLADSIDIDSRVDIAGNRYLLIDRKDIYKYNIFRMVPYIPEKDKNGIRNYRFVSVGRMSPEKNQIRLIKAFDRLHNECSNTYLYIIGDGPLKEEMQKTISSLKSRDAIILSGNIDNPFAIMKYCDCFILPSLHEGQPMTIHEARALHMPIIVSNFSSVAGVSLENGQLIIGTELDDIYEGLKSFIKGQVPTDYEFDIRKYNQEAWREFLYAIGDK